jgi:hypothetical protein
MEKSCTSTTFVNKTVLTPELMQKANDLTDQAVSENKDRLIGMSWIIPRETESEK